VSRPLGEGVGDEVDARGEPDPQLAQGRADLALGRLQRLGRVGPFLVRPEHRVEDRGVLQVAGDADVGHGDEAEALVLDPVFQLLGDDRFIELRKRQPEFRRLSKVDAMTESANLDRQARIKAANDAAKQQLEAAQKALNEAVAAIKAKTDLDKTTQQIMIRSAEEAENRRLQTQTEQIEREKAQAVDKIRADHARAIDEVRDRIRVSAILLPPIPAILLGLLIFYRKRRRESATIPESRKRRSQS